MGEFKRYCLGIPACGLCHRKIDLLPGEEHPNTFLIETDFWNRKQRLHDALFQEYCSCTKEDFIEADRIEKE